MKPFFWSLILFITTSLTANVQWIPADQLAKGHTLKTNGDQSVTVLSVNRKHGTSQMYNLAVNRNHNFFVSGHGNGVLVHNSCLQGKFIRMESGKYKLLDDVFKESSPTMKKELFFELVDSDERPISSEESLEPGYVDVHLKGNELYPGGTDLPRLKGQFTDDKWTIELFYKENAKEFSGTDMLEYAYNRVRNTDPYIGLPKAIYFEYIEEPTTLTFLERSLPNGITTGEQALQETILGGVVRKLAVEKYGMHLSDFHINEESITFHFS